MKKILHTIWLLVFCISCSKGPSSSPGFTLAWDGNVVPYGTVAVPKTNHKKIFVHYMPWFETPATNGGSYGQHWKMNTANPPATIASHYNPLTGPYGTSDTNLIDYQLLLMKLSGIDGIFVDWPGTVNYSDYVKNVANTNAVVSRLGKAGLKYAIVYEDQNLQYALPSTQAGQIAQARADMNYIQTNYLKDTLTTYEEFNGKPLILDFGPFGPLQTAAEWDSIFSQMSTAPAFFTYEYQSPKGGADAEGEFGWVQQNDNTLANLTAFYNHSYGGEKVAAAFPGFNTYYAAGGWPGPTWTIPYTTGSTSTFANSLSVALTQSGSYVQVVTWNDYGEGTMIEPTTQYQYSFLTTLQQQLGVQGLSQSDLAAVYKLYTTRYANIVTSYNPTNLRELDQVYYDMVSLKMDSAKGLLNNF